MPVSKQRSIARRRSAQALALARGVGRVSQVGGDIFVRRRQGQRRGGARRSRGSQPAWRNEGGFGYGHEVSLRKNKVPRMARFRNLQRGPVSCKPNVTLSGKDPPGYRPQHAELSPSTSASPVRLIAGLY
jgi:hypothetical protein